MNDPYTPSHEIAYCMGLIVGEGSFTGDRLAPALQVRLHDSDPEPLLDLQRVFGGTIYGPYVHGGRHYLFWKLVGWQLLEALPYVDRWLPPSRKRCQFDEWRARWSGYFERLPKVSRFSLTGRPAGLIKEPGGEPVLADNFDGLGGALVYCGSSPDVPTAGGGS